MGDPLLSLLAAAKASLLRPAPKGPGAGAVLHRTAPWRGDEAEARRALGDADATTELRVSFGSRQVRRGLIPLSGLGPIDAIAGGVVVFGMAWRTWQCYNCLFPVGGNLSEFLSVAWDAPNHGLASVRAVVEDSPALAAHDFVVSPDFSRVLLEDRVLPRAPWASCGGGSLFAAIPTAILVLVKGSYKNLAALGEAATRAGAAPAALERAIELLCGAFAALGPSDESEHIDSALLTLAIALEGALRGADAGAALESVMSGRDASTIARWAFPPASGDDATVELAFALIISACVERYDHAASQVEEALTRPRRGLAEDSEGHEGLQFFGLHCHGLPNTSSDTLSFSIPSAVFSRDTALQPWTASKANASGPCAAAPGAKPASGEGVGGGTGGSDNCRPEVTPVAFEHVHKTHSAVLVYSYHSGVLSADAAHDIAEFLLRIPGVIGILHGSAVAGVASAIEDRVTVPPADGSSGSDGPEPLVVAAAHWQPEAGSSAGCDVPSSTPALPSVCPWC